MRENPHAWAHISLTDLFFAFRKAKADCYYETSVRVAEKFVLYEQDLGDNLATLLTKLQNADVSDIIAVNFDNVAIFPKKLASGSAANSEFKSHVFFSDSERSLRELKRSGASPEFRIIGDFSVEVHILSALWVNYVGHKFDAELRDSALASRLRRYRKNVKPGVAGGYHLEAIGSFEPYYEPYRKWRDNGLKAIKSSIDQNDGVAALTLDVSNFYHSIDCSFVLDPRFHEEIGVTLTKFETEFTSMFVRLLSDWSRICSGKIRSLGCSAVINGGLPIGLSTVRILANSILSILDKQIEDNVLPVYYARYVDDIFLVIKDSGNFYSQEDLWGFLSERVPLLKRDEGSPIVQIRLPDWAGMSDLRFHTEKQKSFFLKGKSGSDLIENISSQIKEISSERRLMPLPEDLDRGQAAKSLTASSGIDDADSLRRADGLTLRRLGWSVLLRSIEVLARDLRAADWQDERHKFYDFAHEHVIRPDRILEHLDRLPRLFSIAVSQSDWSAANRIFSETNSAIYELENLAKGENAKINGHVCGLAKGEMWQETKSRVASYFREALLRAYPTELKIPQERSFDALIAKFDLSASKLAHLALLVREADWARLPYKEHIRLHAKRHSPAKSGEDCLLALYPHLEKMCDFLTRSSNHTINYGPSRLTRNISGSPFLSLTPFLFPIRAYSPQEIALYLPEKCVTGEPISAANEWAEYTRAVRGIWVRGDLAEEFSIPDLVAHEPSADDSVDPENAPDREVLTAKDNIFIQGRKREFPLKVGITSFETSDDTWAQSANGDPDVSPKRYRAIARVINNALREPERPDYIVFPELSLPEKWIPTISDKLREGGISLIGGLDYTHFANGEIESSAVLVLDDHRLGYPASLQLRQRKSEPAPGEDNSLHVSHGKNWRNPCTEPKPIYCHNDFYFSVLVCSELQNIRYRSDFQGNVDCLFVISWNKDIETFSALVDSASLDVHSYVALSNNRKYGDSRVRRPAKDSFERDLCRVRGGINDQLVIVSIDPRSLRSQQSRAKRWPQPKDAYKPAPEGFEVCKRRKSVPS